MLKKNDRVILDITDYTDEGLGVGKTETGEGTFALFVKDTAIGDRVEAQITKVCKNYGYARLVSVIEPSADRTDPLCPVASRCGGCSLRHITYEAQLKWKKKRVSDCMERIALLTPDKDFQLFEPLGMTEPLRYRNKAQYPVGIKEGHIVTGFYAGRTHSVIASEDCLIEPEIFGGILKHIRAFAEAKGISVYDEKSGKGILRHVLLREGMGGKEIMVCLIVNVKPGDRRLVSLSGLSEKLQTIPQIKTILLSHNTARTNVILGEKETLLFGSGRIRDFIGGISYGISARSFYQVNPFQTRLLYEKAAEFAGLTGNEIVWDLYCGTGTISLFLAGKARAVYGVEIVERAVADAIRNAEENGIENAVFACGRAEDIVIADSEGREAALSLPPPDVVVVDPPRKGCDARLIETIAGSGADRLVYVSCNPATFARDAALLKEKGYSLECLQPVDMFPHTTGVEVVGRFCC